MESQNNKGKADFNLSVLLFIIAIICFGSSTVFQLYTLIDWWQPVALCLPLAVIAGWGISYLLRRAIDTKSYFWTITVGTITSLPILTLGFFMLNDYLSKPETRYTVDTIVVDLSVHKKWTRSSNKMRYDVSIKLPDNRLKKFDVRKYEVMEQYCVGDTIPLTIEDGYFGFPVIKNKHLPLPDKNIN